VQDANANGVGDVVDIPSTGSGQRQATAAELNCHVYLPLVVAQ
jgi:hypothetical protein